MHFINKEVLWQVQLSCLFLLIAVGIAAEEKKTQKQVSLGIHKFDVDSLKEKVRWNVLYEKKKHKIIWVTCPLSSSKARKEKHKFLDMLKLLTWLAVFVIIFLSWMNRMKDLKRCLKVGFTCKVFETFYLSIFQSFNINFSPNIFLYVPF